MIKLALTLPDAEFLRAKLAWLAEHIDNELVHTDARSMQRAIAFDARRLELLREDLDRAVETELEKQTFSTSREMR
jgi:hypothetical protein